MKTSHSVEDDGSPPPYVPLVVNVLDRDQGDCLQSRQSPTHEGFSDLRTIHQSPSTMETSFSAADCSSPSEDDDALNLPMVVDVLDRDRTHDGIESSGRMMAYDELHEILSWMPAKSAIKYSSSLCKWLCNIHSEPRFIQKQCIRSRGQHSGFFLQNMLRDFERVPNDFEFHVLPWETRSAFGIPSKSLNYLLESARILSSSNGLLLLGNTSLDGIYEFQVCNPATRKWAPLPTPDGSFKFIVDKDSSPLIECYPWGLGVLNEVEFPNDYSIAIPVRVEPTVHHVSIEGGYISYTLHEACKKQKLLIYSNGRWEEELCDVSIEGRVVLYEMPVAFFSETTKGIIVHYLTHTDRDRCRVLDDAPGDRDYLEPYIAAFDIRGKKLLRVIKLPEGACDAHFANRLGGCYKKLWIFKWNETSICLVRWFRYSRRMEAWVLDDYGCEGESWRLVMSVSEMELWSDYDRDWTMSVGVAGGGEGLLIATAPAYPVHNDDEPSDSVDVGSRLYLYVVEGEAQGRLELVGEHCFGSHYTLSPEPDSVTFIPYANTLRPVSVLNAETCSY